MDVSGLGEAALIDPEGQQTSLLATGARESSASWAVLGRHPPSVSPYCGQDRSAARAMNEGPVGRLTVTKILLVRHGHVEGIRPERFRGRADLALTAEGRADEQTARRIASAWRPTAIYTSPLSRCVATGAAIAAVCRIEARAFDDLVDIGYGAWQFKTFDEARADDPNLFAAWFATPHLVRFPGGEPLQDVVARTSDALRHALARHGGATVVLVGHDSVNRALLLQLLDQPLSAYWRLAQSPCCINEIDIAGGCIEILRVNDTTHLDSERSPVR
jgi:phosphoserine phosphatase